MAAAVTIDFRVGGIARVNEAFEGVSRRMTRMEQESLKEAEKAAAARERLIVKETQSKARELEKQSRLGVAMSKDVEKMADKAIKDSDRTEKERTKAVERSAREISRIRERDFRDAQKFANDSVRETERAESEKTRIAERHAKARQTVQEKFARGIGGSVGGSLSRMGGAAMNMAGAALAVGGGFAIGDVVRSGMSAESAAAALAVSAYDPSDPSKPRPKVRDIMGRAKGVSISSGIDKASLIKGWQEYVKLSSDFKGGSDNLGDFANLSKASGTDFKELMQTAGILRAQNKNMKPAEMMNVLRGIVGQGKMGAVEFTDMAKYAGAITSTSGLYGGNQSTNQQRLLGLAQIARRTTEGSADTATVVSRFGSDVASNRDRIKKQLGVTTTNADGTLLQGSEIVARMMLASGGDIGKLKNAGIGKESMKLFEAMLPTFRDAGRGKAGADAVRKEGMAYETAGYSKQGVLDDLAVVQGTSAEKIQKSVNVMREALEDQLAPAVQRFADKLPEILPKIEAIITSGGQLADWFINNPIKGVGGIILAGVTKDLAGVAIGEAVKAAILRLLAGGGGVPVPPGGVPLPTATPTMASRLATIGGGVALAAAIAVAGKGVIDTVAGGTGAGDFKAGQMVADLKSGKITAAQAQKMVDEAKGRGAAGAITPMVMGDQLLAAGGAGDATGADKRIAKVAKVAEDRALVNSIELRKAIADAVTGGVRDGMTASNRKQPLTSPERGGTN